MSTAQSFDRATIDVVGNEHYAQHGYPHAEWTWLRNNEPVFWYERPGFEPFWCITKHADIIEIGQQPKLFLNGPRMAIFDDSMERPEQVHQLLNMDPPEHAKYRRVTSSWFTPRAIRAMDEKVVRVVDRVLADVRTTDSGDFVRDISARITIEVIAEMLGVPESDWELLFRWTNEIIAPQDPEFQRGSVEDTFEASRMELFQYFNAMAQERRKRATDDITSVAANGTVDGQPLEPLEMLSYCMLLVVAGNETTRNAMTGGMLALMENPEQWQRLQADGGLVDSAVEEIVRWTTPVIQFARTAVEEYPLRGKVIRKDEAVCLFYGSGCRDEEIFEDPQSFRIDRDPNPHIGFGMGEHVCLGAHLARLELRHTFARLREMLLEAELTGPVDRVASSFVGGIKRAPMRWRWNN